MDLPVPACKMHNSLEGDWAMPGFTPLVAVVEGQRVCAAGQLTLAELQAGGLEAEVRGALARCLA